MGNPPGAWIERLVPQFRPAGVGPVAWLLATVAGQPGVRYGLLLLAVAAGLVGSAALLGHAANAPTLSAYERNEACGTAAPAPPDCRSFVSATVEEDRQLPFGVHAVTLSLQGREAVYYGWAETYYAPTLAAGSGALLVGWHGRVARVVGPGLTVEPFEGPPGSGFLLITIAVLCEFLCGLAIGAQSLVARLHARLLPLGRPALPALPARSPVSFQVVFLCALGVALVAGRSGHAVVAAPLHALCGLVMAAQFTASGLGSGSALLGVARRGIDGRSEERALRLGGDVLLAAVLALLCLSLAADLVVADLLTLPR
jgi:hypothetical protein